MSQTKQDEPLTGGKLLEAVKKLGSLSKEEKARACGYYTVTKNGIERVNMMKFLNALIDAEGIKLDGDKYVDTGRGGRSASYRISIQSNGNLLIGSAYTKKMNLEPGDEFEITLGRKHIHLKQIIEEAEDETAGEELAEVKVEAEAVPSAS
ncbi:MAG: AbrB family transcriptional regulator [Hormoscilla sp. SP5CHS1]|nr:AbrB family transcriptional regulator [Hormoscilla sp. SP12CHS1]MBC6455744.1 AbrB family transcriptional regulator [Hormoscilla sp. SP5CHS1]MBC6472764.1 AbrB family transcriptional regulator [Hormoscilla sp. GM102CHS1]